MSAEQGYPGRVGNGLSFRVSFQIHAASRTANGFDERDLGIMAKLEIKPAQAHVRPADELGHSAKSCSASAPAKAAIAPRSFKVWEGGGEYNVARCGLQRYYSLKTADRHRPFADGGVGRLLEDFYSPGRRQRQVYQVEASSTAGSDVRNGLVFTERGRRRCAWRGGLSRIAATRRRKASSNEGF